MSCGDNQRIQDDDYSTVPPDFSEEDVPEVGIIEDVTRAQDEESPSPEEVATGGQESVSHKGPSTFQKAWIVDRLIYADFVPGAQMTEAETIIADHGCEVYEWGRFESEDVISYTLLVPEGVDEQRKVEEFKAEPLVLRAGDYYWEKKIERMADSDHAPGEVIVGFVEGIDDEGAKRILTSHGYGKDQIEFLHLSLVSFVVHFYYEGDDNDEMVLVIRDFLLDEWVRYAEPNYRISLEPGLIEGVVEVVFNEGVTRTDAEAVIAAHGCEIHECTELKRLIYLVEVPEGRSDGEIIQEFRDEPSVWSAGPYIVW